MLPGDRHAKGRREHGTGRRGEKLVNLKTEKEKVKSKGRIQAVLRENYQYKGAKNNGQCEKVKK